uniref:Uncharacterized protein n=1 Tax=Timema bartmani TaxID=61472 RepID=A0A7R9EY73_9NEOP|nr:unnamed protein product [Timema bartmani]
MSWQTVPTPLMNPSETMGDNSCQPPLTPVPIVGIHDSDLSHLKGLYEEGTQDVVTQVFVQGSNSTPWLIRLQNYTSKRKLHLRARARTSVRPSDLLTKQLEWGQPVELSLPCEEHCLSSRWSAKPPTASGTCPVRTGSQSCPPRHCSGILEPSREPHRLCGSSWPSSTGSLEICQAFLSRFFSRTCLRIESGKEACGALLGRCLGVEASSDPLMAEVMNSAPRSISAAVRKVGVGPNLSLNTFVNLSQLVRLRCCVQWITRHGRLREHKVWSGPGSREGGWHGRCKCGEKVNSEAQQSRIWVDGALSEWFGIEQGVNNPFIYDQFIQSIPLAIPQQNIPSGVLATTSGWGAIDKMCLFCDDEENDKEALVSAQTLGCGPTTRSWAEELRDLKVLKKLTSLDLVTLEAKYHKKCYVSLQNHACTNKQKWEPQRENKRLNNMDILFKNMNSLLQSAKEDAQKKLKDQYAMQRREGQLIIGPI